MGFEGFPFVIGWELTLACNQHCRHCGSSAGNPRHNELTTHEALKICDQFPELLVQEVDFTGGESLLRPDWFDIAMHLKDLGINTQIISNGLAIDNNKIKLMKEAGISGLGISLDGMEKTHDYIRGNGSFHQVLKSLDLLHEASIPATILTTVNALNIGELSSMLELLLLIKAAGWRLQPMIPSGRGQECTQMQMNERTFMRLEEFIRDNWPYANKAGMDLIRSDGIGYFYEEETNEKAWQGCTAGITTCGITSNGLIKGCLALADEFVEGDLRKRDLWDIWFDPDSFAYTRHFSSDNLGENCASCDKSMKCRGGCSAKSSSNTGQFHNDPYCRYRIDAAKLH